MAFDGITVAALVKECGDALINGKINKIAQPEADELILTVKNNGVQHRLALSASASLPLIYLTDQNRPSPMTAPNFCMLLRKHIQSGRIVSIVQPGLERIIRFEIEHLNELGDLCTKYLIVEIMGKHSNIIFCDGHDRILDSIKHISGMVSSVREVLPGRDYFVPRTQEKADPLSTSREEFQRLFEKGTPVYQALYTFYTGLSPSAAQELSYETGIDADRPANTLTEAQQEKLFAAFTAMTDRIRRQEFSPCIVYENHIPAEFSALPLRRYAESDTVREPSISRVVSLYYSQKEALTRIRQKSSDLRRIAQTALERNVKKYDLQRKQMEDTKKRETYRVYGELLNTYGYGAQPGAKKLEAQNYYTGGTVVIPLDETLTSGENAKKYFEKYGKLKRTYEALSELTVQVKSEIEHLESILSSLDIAQQEEDLVQIREELIESGYMKRRGGARGGKKPRVTSRPFHYISSDGYHMYVGKNNFQNDELTFKFASGGDWWFHAKGIPGSHVIVKSGGAALPDRVFEEAARLAAYYSKGRGQEKVEIDYVEKKHVKKPGGAKPGFVVYYTNYSMMIDTDISGLREITD